MSADFVIDREDRSYCEVWNVSSGVFRWVVEIIADHVEDPELAAELKIIAEGSARLALTYYSEPQAAEIVRVIRESLRDAVEKEYPFNEHRPGILEAIDHLMEMAARWERSP